ncbi:MAG: hypothetical protein ACLVJH_08205 [Faecalibacterium prausnitzii]
MKEQDAQAVPQPEVAAGVPKYLKTKILNCEHRPNEFLNEQKLWRRDGQHQPHPYAGCAGASGAGGGADHRTLPKKGLDGARHHQKRTAHSMFEMRLLVEPYALRTYGNAIPGEQLEAYAELMHHSERIEDFCKSDDELPRCC